MRIAFLGLGPMGHAIARRLVENKFNVTVWNRTQGACEPFQRIGAAIALSPTDAVRDADFILTMLRDDDALRSVMLESGVIKEMRDGSVHVALSSISSAMATMLLAEHRSRRQDYVSAPVFGGPPAASAGALWTIAAGRRETLAQLSSLFNTYSRGVTLIGEDPSQANAVKLAGNALTVALTGGLSEATATVAAAGVPAERFHEVMDNAVFQSPIFRRFSNAMLRPSEEPGPFVWQGLQILRYFLNLSKGFKLHTPILGALNNDLKAISGAGHGNEGFAGAFLSLAKRNVHRNL